MFNMTATVFQMPKPKPVFFSTLSVELGNDYNSQVDSDGFGECINELAESFVAFIEGRYGDASEVKFYCR
jgi:hypothetical protein